MPEPKKRTPRKATAAPAEPVQGSFRILDGQSEASMAKQGLMILSNELRLAVYRQPFQIGDPDQRAALLHILNTEFNTTIALPDGKAVVYLVIADGVPTLWPEEIALGINFGYALGKGGLEAARRVTWRPDMLPATKE